MFLGLIWLCLIRFQSVTGVTLKFLLITNMQIKFFKFQEDKNIFLHLVCTFYTGWNAEYYSPGGTIISFSPETRLSTEKENEKKH